MVLIGGAEEHAAIQQEMSTWLKKIGDKEIGGTGGEERRR
jgi:hypothetical protein